MLVRLHCIVHTGRLPSSQAAYSQCALHKERVRLTRLLRRYLVVPPLGVCHRSLVAQLAQHLQARALYEFRWEGQKELQREQPCREQQDATAAGLNSRVTLAAARHSRSGLCDPAPVPPECGPAGRHRGCRQALLQPYLWWCCWPCIPHELHFKPRAFQHSCSYFLTPRWGVIRQGARITPVGARRSRMTVSPLACLHPTRTWQVVSTRCLRLVTSTICLCSCDHDSLSRTALYLGQ